MSVYLVAALALVVGVVAGRARAWWPRGRRRHTLPTWPTPIVAPPSHVTLRPRDPEA